MRDKTICDGEEYVFEVLLEFVIVYLLWNVGEMRRLSIGIMMGSLEVGFGVIVFIQACESSCYC